MGRRFKALDAALKYLRTTTQDDSGVVPDAPTGSQLRFYQDYKAGKRQVEYTRDSDSKQISIDELKIKPFGFAAADTNEYIVPYSTRAKNGLASTGLELATLGADAALSGAVRVYGFTSARVVVSVRTGTTEATPDSKITGKKYTKVGDTKTYTYPFGRTTGNPAYGEQKAAILAAVIATAGRGASFKPEKFV